MLLEVVYKNGFYLRGTAAEVIKQLALHCLKYTTVKELLEDLSPGS